jgi:hypothetical protein
MANTMRFCEQCGAAFQSMRFCPRDRGPTRVDLSDPLLGRVIGERYRILDRVAAGGMGQVYRAAHVRIASLFALKVLYGDLAHDPEMRARFQREAEAASVLSSRHIVRVVDFGETPAGLSYLVMEYVDGTSLSGVLSRRGALPEMEAVTIAKQIARGLAHAHERGIVHRDLKPDNIMMVPEEDEGPVAKLLDFGLASVKGAGTRLTRVGQIFGTPEYMAPEQFLGADADGRVDLYALGVILFELLTGRLPFFAPSLNELAMMHTSAPPPSLAAEVPALRGSPLTGLVDRLLQKRAADRPASARAVLDVLRALDAPPISSVATSARAEPAVPSAVVEPIRAAISAGAPLYNAGDHGGCARLYWLTADKLLTEVTEPRDLVAVAARLRTGQRRASRAESPSAGAWEMRFAFDDLLHCAATELIHPRGIGREIAVAELIAAPRYGSGHLELVGDYYLELVRGLRGLAARNPRDTTLVAHLDRLAAEAAPLGGTAALSMLTPALDAFRTGAQPTLASAPLVNALVPSSRALLHGVVDSERYAQRLVQAISVGAPAYNAGDIAGCLRVYRHTAETLVSELRGTGAAPQLAERLQGAVSAASGQTVEQGAWTLRHAFDEILAAASAAPVARG